MKKSNLSTLKRVFKYLKKHWALVLLSVLFALGSVLITLYIPIRIGNAIDLIIEAGKVDFDKMMPILFEIGILALCVALLQWVMNNINNKITYNVTMDVRNDAFDKIEGLPLKFVDSHQYGEIVSKMISDVDQFTDGLLMGFTQFFTGVATIIGTLCFMLYLSPIITIVVVVFTPLSLLIASFISKSTFKLFKKQSEKRGNETSLVDEAIGNLKVVKVFSQEDEMQQKFELADEELKKVSIKAIFFSSLVNPTTRFVNALVYAGVALVGAFTVMNVIPIGALSIGALATFLSYANQYAKPFNEISGVVTELQNALACASRVFDLIDEDEEIKDNENALVLNKPNGDVDLCDVAFSYSPDKDLIKGLNLSVKGGMRVAIVGPTGCGKTTLINLLMRFYDVNSGSISVDGTDIRDITRHSLRHSYGMVLQETWLQGGTIRDNIKMGKPEATDEEVIQAAKECHAHSFIKRLPLGYDTIVSDESNSLSQGQKQLLCISRIMLALPEMLILDEATSSIDTRTELKIQESFLKLMKGRTSFVVAHRLSTIREADVILVMNKGNIVEMGNHNELINKKGFYWELYNSQFSTTE
ncbi:MAG: ABC transporter ATP-binding protein [Clostridia bacterium]|nr:ABC transporter ATP-binding protein [Clostridia bacterium]